MTCVLTLGQRGKPYTTHPTAGTRLEPGSGESRTPSTDTTGNSRQACAVVRNDGVHNSEIGSYSPTPFLAVWPPHASAERTARPAVVLKACLLVLFDPAHSRPRRRPLAMGSRGDTGKCQDRLAPGKAMQLRDTRLESLRELALDATDAEEDDETGADTHRT